MKKNNILNLTDVLGTLIFENTFGYFLYIKFLTDTTSKRQTMALHIVDPNGSISEEIKINRSSLLNNRNCLNKLLDYEGDFSKDDILKIHQIILNDFKDLQQKATKISLKLPIDEVYTLLCNYIKRKAHNKTCKEIFIKDKLGYIETSHFNNVLSDLDLLGYTRKELLATFANYELLVCSPNRSYDLFKKSEGTVKHYYCFKLFDNSTNPMEGKGVA